MGHLARSVYASPGVMVLTINQSLNYHELIPTPDFSGPAPTFIPLCSKYFTLPVLSTMSNNTPFHCPQFSCSNNFKFDSRRLKHIQLQHAGNEQVAKNLIVLSVPRLVDRAQCHELNANKHSIKGLAAFSYLKHVENIATFESQLTSPSLRRTQTYPGTSALLCDYIAEPQQHNAQGFLETNLQNNP